MSIFNYKRIIEVLNQNNTLTQVALGIGDIDTNPDLEDILKYTRECNIVPNITINGTRMNDYYFDMLAKYCGAVSVSHYNLESTLHCINELHSRINHDNNTLKNVNIHIILCKDTLEITFKFMKEYKNFIQEKVGAIVFLTMKPIGNRNPYISNNDSKITEDEYKEIIDFAIDNGISIGFDSCGCNRFLNAIKNDNNKYEKYKIYSESCESTLFSIYVNVDGIVFPCSFCEHSLDFYHCTEFGIGYNPKDKESCICLVDKNKKLDLLMDVWFNERLISFRKLLIDSMKKNEHNCRECPLFS